MKSERQAARRGRPRDDDAEARVLSAARALLAEGGVPAVTMHALAERAGVGRPLLYRRWPNAQSVAMAALMETAPHARPDGAEIAPLEALKAHLTGVADLFASRLGRSAALLAASASRDTELFQSFRNQVILNSRAAGRALLEQAVRNGELDGAMDMEAVLDATYGAVFFRVLMGHADLDPEFPAAVLDLVLSGARKR